MARLISEKVYQPVRINDYQAVCFQEKNDGSPGNILQTPFKHFFYLLQWLAKIIAWTFIQLAMLPAHAMNNLDEYACKSIFNLAFLFLYKNMFYLFFSL